MRVSAVFVDRDGVLNRYLPGEYVLTPETLEVMPGVAGAIRRLNDAGLPVAIISNQQGVGKGQMSMDDLSRVQARLAEVLRVDAGACIDRSYFCTDLRSANSPRRKPKPGMLLEAAADLGLPLEEIVFLGDSQTDVEAGIAARVGAACLLLTGATSVYDPDQFAPTPHRIFTDLNAAVDWILEENF